jgi:sugar transferase (PEP-CTERM system associated)
MWRVFLRYLAFRKFGAVVVENVLLVCCVLDAVHIRLREWPVARPSYPSFLLRAFLIAVVFQLFLHFRDVYDFRKTPSFAQFLAHLAQAIMMASGLLAFVYYLVPDLMVGRGVFLISVVLVSVFLTVWHTLLRVWVGVRAPRSNVLVLGTGRLARELVTEILRHPELGIGVSGFVDENPALVGVSVVNPKVIGLYKELPRIVAETKVDRIVVELQDRRGRLPIEELLTLKTQGVAIEDATSLYERITGKIAIENLKPSWMIFNAGFDVSKRKLLHKRIVSLLVSSVLLILFTPIILIAMVLIRLDSRGSVFHRQERVGQDGQVFTLWKFRSMYEDAESSTGPVWASEHDPRITRVGKILRVTRFDELPQLINVIRGDMSLVGPRPERPHFVNELSSIIPFYHLRHAVKPGVTGWAQINYGYGNSVRDAVEKLQYDLFYIKHMSALLDFLIVFETVKTVLFRRGL